MCGIDGEISLALDVFQIFLCGFVSRRNQDHVGFTSLLAAVYELTAFGNLHYQCKLIQISSRSSNRGNGKFFRLLLKIEQPRFRLAGCLLEDVPVLETGVSPYLFYQLWF